MGGGAHGGSPVSQASDGDGALGVVITGASRGLGFALAREHLAAGDSVVICGRDDARLRAACEALRRQVPGASVHATVCDVGNGHGGCGCRGDEPRQLLWPAFHMHNSYYRNSCRGSPGCEYCEKFLSRSSFVRRLSVAEVLSKSRW